ncbi:MAG: hypothetical protein AAF399_28380 [Bacteroidota bacterium]
MSAIPVMAGNRRLGEAGWGDGLSAPSSPPPSSLEAGGLGGCPLAGC